MKKFLLLSLCFLFGCKSGIIVQKFPEDQELSRASRAGNISGNKDGFILLQDQRTEDNKEKKIEKKYDDSNSGINEINLWKKSLNVISSIAPLSIVDENLGLISTDWSNLNNLTKNTNLCKINVIVKNKKIDKQNIQISVFEKDKSGNVLKNIILEEKILELILK